ncbi:MAG: Ig-like domain-containing protein [Patescibacteria group bacterium]|nr:hypothetical protein [Patescibacteria group bacterium]
MKKRLTIFLAVLLVFTGMFFAKPSLSFAFPSVLGTKIIGNQEVYIDGYEVEDPYASIFIDSTKPTFYGYTIANAEVLLIIASDPIEIEILSDADGYWFHAMENPLEVGQHTLTLKITDSSGIASEEILVATFNTPEVKGEEATVSTDTPLPKTPRINYLSISLIVLGSLLLLGVTYIFLARKSR